MHSPGPRAGRVRLWNVEGEALMCALARLAAGWLEDEAGASVVEYVLIVALVAVVSIGAASFLGGACRRQFDLAAVALNRAGTHGSLPTAFWPRP
jgi:Flp pilus assembly pilin Flp